MNELSKLLQEKFGLSEEVAANILQTVAGFVKTKLPENLQGTVDKLMAGESLESVGGGLFDSIKGLFSGDKNA